MCYKQDMGMASKLSIILASLTIFLTASPAPAQPPGSPLAGRNIIVLKAERNAPAGAAVLLAPRLVLTAAHVVHASIVQIVCAEQVIPAVVRGQDADVDLALLELLTPCTGIRPTALAENDPEFAQEVYAIGCPDGNCGRVTRGIVSGYEHGRLISDTKVWFGSSGGGLYMPDGTLVGISSMIHIMSDNGEDRGGNKKNEPFSQVYGIFVPVSVIRPFLAAVLVEMRNGRGEE